MNRFSRYMPLIVPSAVAVVLIVLCSIVQGLWTDRWSSTVSEKLREFADAFEEIPMIVGDWEGDVSGESSERELEAAGAVGHLSRVYRNPKTGQTISVYMICGASRNVAIHTPDACYPGAGFRPEGESHKYSVQTGSSQVEFFTNVFLRENPTGSQRLRLFWAWNADGTWESPAWPRMKYGGRTALNKMYLICPTPHGQTTDKSPALEFADLFIPEVNRALFPDQAEELAVPLATKPSAQPASPKPEPMPEPVPVQPMPEAAPDQPKADPEPVQPEPAAKPDQPKPAAAEEPKAG